MNMIEEYQREHIPDDFDPFESLPGPPRFDEPSVQLETRGTTQRQKPTGSTIRLELHQQLLWSKATIHKNTTAAKLREIGRGDLAETLEKCHTIYTVCQCSACGTVKKFPNRCDLFYCAECQPRLAADRRKAVEWWTHEITQPKHVTLTVKNLPDMNKFHVREFRKWFTNLRRSKFARNWIGGFYSLEVTQEGRGWHLHLHALINARYIDKYDLSSNWERVTNGMGRIVDVRDARGSDYLRECLKYNVKGVQLAAWTGEQIATFIDAFTGVRTFGVFGALYGKRTEFAEWFAAVRKSKPKCDCGCNDMNFFTELQWLEMELRQAPQLQALPPPKEIPHPEFPQFPASKIDFGPK